MVLSANTTQYGELSKTAHLDIHKTRKLHSIKNEYKADDSLILASHLITKENYHVFEDVFLILVDTLDYLVKLQNKREKDE